MNSLYTPVRITVPFVDVSIHYNIELIYLYKWNPKSANAPMEYLRRRANLNTAAKHGHDAGLTELRLMYRFYSQRFVRDLTNAIPDGIDAIVIVPSNSPELVEPYRDEIMREHDMFDLTSRVQRREGVSSSSGHSYEDRLNAMICTTLPSDRPLRKILILDDVLHTGLSVAGVAKALSAHLQSPEIVAACPLWVPMSCKQ